MALVGWLHIQLFRLVALALRGLLYLFVKVPVQSLVRLGTAVLAWLHIMVRLWLGVAVGGVLALLAASALLRFSPAGSNWRLVALLVCLVWLVVLFSAARFTVEWFSLRRVRQSEAFSRMGRNVEASRNEIREVRKELTDGLADRTRGTRPGRAFRRNRQLEDAAAEQAAREQRAADADEARRDELAALEPDPY